VIVSDGVLPWEIHTIWILVARCTDIWWETVRRCIGLPYHLKLLILHYSFLCSRLSRFDTKMPADSPKWPPTYGRHPAACVDELWFGFMWWQHRVTDLCLSCKTKLTRPAFPGSGFHIFPGKHLTTLYSLALDLILVLIFSVI